MGRADWIDSELAQQIRELLNNELKLSNFQSGVRNQEEEAALFFQDELFGGLLGFEQISGPTGRQPFDSIPVHDWPQAARTENAYLLSEKGNFRVVYIELESLTRTAERNAVDALISTDLRGAWALEGNYLAVFHERDSETWHLVTPYESDSTLAEGRSKLRRFTIGEGENHRTVAENISGLTATTPGVLSTRIDEAFRVRPVTRDFYDNYREWFGRMEDSHNESHDAEDAKRYAHLTLNRLMFLYFLQNKRWLGGRKDFIRWYLSQYRESDDEGCFHGKWLNALFFEAMTTPEDTPVEADLPEETAAVLEQLPYMNGGLFAPDSDAERRATLPDDLLAGAIEGFLDEYNFTITEESPYDVDVAVDPAMLGKIYESLIAEEERGEAGIFYTPREEVDLMCRMSLYEQFRDRDDDLDAGDDVRLTEFIFADAEGWEIGSADTTEALEAILHDLRIVDPGCGSGAFLVGIMQVLSELYRKVGRTPGYELKRQIINENIYGVDIKKWALRVAEFRLWLNLIKTEDEVPDRRPVLPNFTFNLQQGDSIVQTVGDQQLTMEALSRSPDPEVINGIADLEGLKQRYYDGEKELYEEINRRKEDLLEQHISTMIERKDAGTQQTFGGDTVDDDAAHVAERLRDVREELRSAEADSVFLWELDFSEVMLQGGFDIVIGNPPYISNEFITDPRYSAEASEELPEARRETVRERYKDQLEAYVQRTHGFNPDGQSDYYAYFFYKGHEVLRPGGTLSFITSDKWLDRGYGDDLQDVLLTRTDLRSIVANRLERSFEEADITTAITTFNKIADGARTVGDRPRFVSCSAPYARIADPEGMQMILGGDAGDSAGEGNSDDGRTEAAYRGEPLSIRETGLARIISVAGESLWRLGGGDAPEAQRGGRVEARGDYDGDAWGSVYIRTPTAIFEVLGQQGGKMSTLSDHGVESYLNTGGALKFYVVDEVGNAGDDLVRIRNRRSNEEFVVEERFLKPFVKGPGDIPQLRVTDDHADGARIVAIPPSTDVDQYQISEYIRHGEDLGFHERSGPSGRDPWWQPPTRAANGATVVLPRTHNNNHRSFYNPERVITGRFYRAHPDDDIARFVAGVLNSTFGNLFFEIYGDPRAEGALDLYTPDYRKMPVVDPEAVEDPSLPDGCEGLFNRPIESIFDEVGASSPEEVSLDAVKHDRRAIDEFVMGEILNLSEKQQREVYAGLVRLVDERINKADSV